MRRIFGFVVLLGVVTSGCGASPPSDANTVEPTVEVSSALAEENTVIFNESYASAQLLEINLFRSDFNGYWAPTAEDIQALENGLADYLIENGLPEVGFENPIPIDEALPGYYRQYFGYINAEDNRVVYGNFICTELEDWDEQWIVVEDGGNCFFQVQYDVDNGEYLSLYVNGEA